jgi:hypothetical protein
MVGVYYSTREHTYMSRCTRPNTTIFYYSFKLKLLIAENFAYLKKYDTNHGKILLLQI